MTININFTIPDLAALLAYLIIGFIVALLICFLAGLRSTLAYLITTILTALGGWIMVSFVKIKVGSSNLEILGVPLIEAALGGFIFGLATVVFMRRRRFLVR